jgi:uncharacterized membrane-anchored protein
MRYTDGVLHTSYNDMSIEGGFNRQQPAKVEMEEMSESGENFEPSAELIDGLKVALRLENDASERDVADVYLNSLAHSKTEAGKDQGSPSDLLPKEVNKDDFEEWARRSVQG